MAAKTAGELSKKAFADTTRYSAIEVGHAMTEGIDAHLYASARQYHDMIDEPIFCVVMLVGSDPMIKNLVRRKFYCWPYLPSPRPNQAVFLYEKARQKITKRLWVLPSDMVMAELASLAIVDARYKSMQAWSCAFFEKRFWEYVRYESGVSLLSEHEYFLQNRQKLADAGCQVASVGRGDAFDFSKIHIKKIVDA